MIRCGLSLLVACLLLASAALRAADAQQTMATGNPRAGHDFALQTCTLCHLVSSRQQSPPRVAKGPTFSAIANTRSTTALSLQAFLTTPHPTMPNLVLSPDETANVIAYILSLRNHR